MVAPLKIALLGTRGIPARYGGFETFAEELSTRLVERGHEVAVYSRRPFFSKATGSPQSYRGVECRYAPTYFSKHLETPLHAITSFLDLFRRRCDVVLLCNAANSPFSFLGRLRGVPVLVNVDGIERKRSKWGLAGRSWYKLGEFCSVLFCTRVIADAEVIADYYRDTYRTESEVIAYGANAVPMQPGQVLNRLGLKPDSYILYVSRLEPENNALGVVEAYSRVTTDKPLVIVGDAPYAREYIDRVKRAADKRVIFAGYQFGEAYQELQSNCYMYVQATEVGGTHPALIEAMAHANCVIANGTPENHEVLADAGFFYPKNDFEELARQMQKLLADPELVAEVGAMARARANEIYEWERITDQYEELFYRVKGLEYARLVSKVNLVAGNMDNR